MEKDTISMNDLAPVISEIVNDGGKFRLTVTGKSMFPIFIEERDSVILKKVTRLKRLDIILYKRDNGGYVLHRIVKIKNNILSLCGDNQTMIESPIRPDQVLAVVDGFYRKDRYYAVNNLRWRLYSVIWGSFVSLRPRMYKIYMKIGKK